MFFTNTSNLTISKSNIQFYLIISLVLTPFFLPFSIFLSDLFLSLSSILFIITLKSNSFKKYFLNKFSIAFFIWYIYLIFTSLYSSNIFLSLESTLFYFRFWVYCLGLSYCFFNIKNFDLFFFTSILLSFVIVLFDSYFQLIFKFNIFGYPYDNSWKRLSSFFNDDYILGSYITRMLPLVVGFLFYLNLNIIKKYFFSFIIIFLSLFVVFFSGERSAFIYFFLFLFFFILIIDLSFLIKIIMSLLITAVTVLTISLNQNIYDRIVKFTYFQLFENNQVNFFSIQHQLIYTTSLKIIKDNYIFGIGPKNFRIICNDYKTFSNLDRSENGCSTHPHNTYLQLWAESGLLSFLFIVIFYLAIFFYVFKIIIRKNLFKSSNSNITFELFLISILINLWPLVPTGNFFNNWLSIIYYLPFGFILFKYLEKNNI